MQNKKISFLILQNIAWLISIWVLKLSNTHDHSQAIFKGFLLSLSKDVASFRNTMFHCHHSQISKPCNQVSLGIANLHYIIALPSKILAKNDPPSPCYVITPNHRFSCLFISHVQSKIVKWHLFSWCTLNVNSINLLHKVAHYFRKSFINPRAYFMHFMSNLCQNAQWIFTQIMPLLD